MLAITVVMNLCMFGYIPLVPVVAEGFAASAVLAGALAAAPGLGRISPQACCSAPGSCTATAWCSRAARR